MHYMNFDVYIHADVTTSVLSDGCVTDAFVCIYVSSVQCSALYVDKSKHMCIYIHIFTCVFFSLRENYEHLLTR